jgi:hypothetical protein
MLKFENRPDFSAQTFTSLSLALPGTQTGVAHTHPVNRLDVNKLIAAALLTAAV